MPGCVALAFVFSLALLVLPIGIDVLHAPQLAGLAGTVGGELVLLVDDADAPVDVVLGRQFVLAIPRAYAFAVANWAVIGPMIAITVGIAAVIAIGVLLIKHWDTVKAFGARVWNGIVYGVQTAITWFSNLLNNPFFAAVGVLFAPWITTGFGCQNNHGPLGAD